MTKPGATRESYSIRTALFWPWFTPLYDFGCRVLGFGVAFRKWSVEPLPRHPRARILDLGCATGAALAIVGEQSEPSGASHGFGVDPDYGALSIARRTSRARFVVGLGEALPFRDQCFDAVFCSLALHHIPDEWKLPVLKEVARVLRPGAGFVLVDFENHARWWVPRRFRSRRVLRDWLAEAGFEWVEYSRKWGAHRFVARLARSAEVERHRSGVSSAAR